MNSATTSLARTAQSATNGLPAVMCIAVVIASLTLAASTASAGGSTACGGDCDANGRVAVNELVTAVRISLDLIPVDACPAADGDASATVEIDEIVQAVGHTLNGCPAHEAAIFVIRVCSSPENPDGETFRALMRDPDVIAIAESLIGSAERLIIHGSLLSGDGGFNSPWSWHLDPKTVGFADFAIELCDGCPSFVEEDSGYWIDTVGQYCPWSTEVVARER